MKIEISGAEPNSNIILEPIGDHPYPGYKLTIRNWVSGETASINMDIVNAWEVMRAIELCRNTMKTMEVK